MYTTEHSYQQIFMFDDIDTDNVAPWKDNETENMTKMIKLLSSMFSANPDKEYILLNARQGYEITAFIGGNRYHLKCEGEKKSEVSVCNHMWLSCEEAFNSAIDDMLSAATRPNTQSLFLLDWSLSGITWGEAGAQPNATQILARLKRAIGAGRTIRGTIACYSSSVDHSSFVEGFKEEATAFAMLGTAIKPIKLLWRWDDVQSTLFTLYMKLCKIGEKSDRGCER